MRRWAFPYGTREVQILNIITSKIPTQEGVT